MSSYKDIPLLPKKSVKGGRIRREEFVFDEELDSVIREINARFLEVYGGGITSPSEIEFNNGDLVSGVLSVSHTLGIQYPSSVSVYNNDDELVGGIGVWKYIGTAVNTGELEIFEPSITGTWRIILGY